MKRIRSKRTGWLIALFALVLLLAGVYAVEPLIKSALLKQVNKGENRAYNITVENMNISLLRARVEFNGFKLVPREPAKNSSKQKPVTLNASCEQIEITGLSVPELLFENTLEFGNLEVTHPMLDMWVNPGAEKTRGSGLQDIFSEKFNKATINNVSLTRGKVRIHRSNEDSTQVLSVDSMAFNIQKVSVDSSQLKRLVPFRFKRLEVDFGGLYSRISPQNRLKISHITLNGESKRLKIYNPLLVSSQDSTASGLSGKANHIVITGWDTGAFLTGEKIILDSIRVDHPVLRQIRGAGSTPKATDSTKQTAADSSKMPLRFFKAQNFTVRKASFRQYKNDSSDSPMLVIEPFDFTFGKLQADSLSANKEFPYRVNSGRLLGDPAHIALTDGYHLTLGRLSWNLTRGRFDLGGVHIKNDKKPRAYFQARRFETDHFKAALEGLHITGIDNGAIRQHGILVADSLVIDHFQLAIHRDKRLKDPGSPVKPMPAQLLKQIPVKFAFKALKIGKSSVHYSQLSENSENGNYGTLHFEELTATGSNLTNDSLHIAADPVFRLSARSQFMHKTRMQLQYLVHLNRADGYLECNGAVAPIAARQFNTILKPLSAVRFTSGQLRGVEFSFIADRKKSKGTLSMLYQNLDLEILRREDKHGDGGGTKKILSFVADNFFVRDKNLKGKNFHTGAINFERLPGKSIWNYTFQSVKSGIINTVLPNFVGKSIKKKGRELMEKDNP